MQQKLSSNNQVPTLHVSVRSRGANYFQGTANSVSALNGTGEFDILPLHANFITLIKDFVVLDKNLPTERKIELKSAVLSVLNGNVDVYVGI